MAAHAWPPGPRTSLASLLPFGLRRDPLAFASGLARTYGDISHVTAAGEHLVFLNHPRFVKDVLVTNQRNFRKGRGLERARRLLGDGLLTSEGDTHLRQRRLIQPAFHKERIASYSTAMTDYAERVQRGWTNGATLDVSEEMMRLTLAIVGRTLFDADVEAQAREVGEALTAVLNSFWTTMLPFPDLLETLPIRVLTRGRDARARLDAIIYGLIAERRKSPGDRGDLLSMLMMAQDEEQGGRGMTDVQVRDESMTIFLAGHETTANALAWTWYLLSQAPEVEARLHAEVDGVLGGRTRPWRTSRGFRSSNRWSPSRCGCTRQRGSSGGVRSARMPWTATRCPVRSCWSAHTCCTVTRGSSPSPIGSCPGGGRRSSGRRFHRLRTSRSVAAPDAASASRSRGWSWCLSWRRSHSSGACGWCLDIR